MATISQREARRLRKRVEELEIQEQTRLSRWSSEWMGGTVIVYAKWKPQDSIPVAVRTARALNHAVVATADNDGTVRFHALPLAKG